MKLKFRTPTICRILRSGCLEMHRKVESSMSLSNLLPPVVLDSRLIVTIRADTLMVHIPDQMSDQYSKRTT